MKLWREINLTSLMEYHLWQLEVRFSISELQSLFCRTAFQLCNVYRSTATASNRLDHRFTHKCELHDWWWYLCKSSVNIIACWLWWHEHCCMGLYIFYYANRRRHLCWARYHGNLQYKYLPCTVVKILTWISSLEGDKFFLTDDIV